MRDLAFAFRSLRKSPGFALTAIATIGLGIGASTAIFSVVDTVLLRPLPYRDPDRLALVWSELKTRHLPDFPLSPPDFADMRRTATLFTDLTAVNTGRVSVYGDNAEAEQIKFGAVVSNFFQVLGGRIELGRDFTDSDATPAPPAPVGAPAAAAPGPPAMVILSHEFWTRRYAADPGVIGRGIDLGFGKALIVGVVSPGFELLFPASAGQEPAPDLWLAMRLNYATADRNNVFLRVIGRMKPRVTAAQAQAQLGGLAADLREHFPVKKTAGMEFTVEPMQQRLVAASRPALVALMGAVIFLLLISCANVGNLLLVRMAARGRELAVRAALGGNRWRLVRQMLVESLLISAAGAVLGVALARLGIDLLVALGPKNLPRLNDVALDPIVLGFALLAAVASAAAFGIVPALRASRPRLAEALRAGGRNSGLGSGAWLRNAVVMAEVALSFVLLIGSGLMLRSFLALVRTDPGFDAGGKLTFYLPVFGVTPEMRAAQVRDLRDRFAALPGVTSVTAASPFPLDGGIANGKYAREDAVTDPSRFRQANVFFVLPGYFDAMRTRIVEGRGFTEADNTPKQAVVIIDQLLAAKAFPRESAVGKRLYVRIRTPLPEWVQVVGVAAHQRHESLSEDGREEMFVTDGFVDFGAVSRWAVGVHGDPMNLVPRVRQEIARFDKRLAVGDIMPMQSLVEKAQAQTRFALILIALFAVIAAALAAVGLYGVISSAVRQRTAEIGVRIAVGAEPGRIFRLVVAQGLRLSAAGIVMGILAAFVLTRVLESMLIGVKATDPPTYAAMAAGFFVVTIAACWLPARRAAGLNPVRALREE